MEPKLKIGDTVECPAIVGWVRAIYTLYEVDKGNTKENGWSTFLYAVEEPESESIGFYEEEELLEPIE